MDATDFVPRTVQLGRLRSAAQDCRGCELYADATQAKRRLHAKPDTRHVVACRPWLTAELRSVAPRAVVALGATAAQALFGPAFRLSRHRTELLPWPPPEGPYADSDLAVEFAAATIHPSAVLRAGDARAEMRAGLVADLRAVAGAVR